MKQTFIQLLFKFAFANLNKELKPPTEITEAKQEFLEETDEVKLFLDETVIDIVNDKDNNIMKLLVGIVYEPCQF